MLKTPLTIMALLVATASFADRIEVIELQNRPADEIIRIIQPLMQANEALSGTGYTLILRASPATVANVKSIVSKLDAAPKNLMISVAQDDLRRGSESAAGATIRYDSDVGTGVSARIQRNDASDEVAVAQQMRVLEGTPAYIHTGRVSRIPGRVYHGDGSVRHGSVRQHTGAGFYVLPRLNGNRIDLEINPHLATSGRSGTGVSVQNAQTVVSGYLGEWIVIGGSSGTSATSQSGILYTESSSDVRDTGIRVKVEIVE